MALEYQGNAAGLETKAIASVRVYFSREGESIPILKQRTSTDCGQTALEMVGFNGQTLSSQGEIDTHQIFRLMVERMGINEAYANTFVLFGEESGMDYSRPHLVLLQKTGVAHRSHWVIRIDDRIICPSAGVVEARQYLEGNSYAPVIAFKLPRPLLH